MGRTADAIDPATADWIARQPVFFVATAPAGPEGHVNLSPKGLDTFRVLGPKEVAYLDLTGSGVETIAHLRQNGRITVMFCAFAGPPRILRLFGLGRVIEPGDDRFTALAEGFPDLPGVRSIISVALDRVADSCGYAVPRMDLVGDRDRLVRWAEAKGTDGLAAYQARMNRESIDGLPGLAGDR
jgi:hypothetical protein